MSGDGNGLRSVRILLVDDSPDDRALVIRHLRQTFHDVDVTEIGDAEMLESALEHFDFDLAITDCGLRSSDGIQVLTRIKGKSPATPVIMFTGSASDELIANALKAGLDDYVAKSSRDYLRLMNAVAHSLERSAARRTLHDLDRQMTELRQEMERLG